MNRNYVAIIGAGAWGKTLAMLFSRSGHTVQTWSRQHGTTQLATMVRDADVLVSAVSMKGVRAVIAEIETMSLSSQTLIVSATKGLDPISQKTNSLPLLPSQLWQQAFPSQPVVVLSGPNLAKEIQQGLPAATVVASVDQHAAATIQTALSSREFRVYTNPDPLGVELGVTLKNVIAIAIGTCDGLNLGTNAKAALVTRGLAEIIRIGTYWGAQPDTFYGLSGLGDLLATCNSSLSRNYQVGYGLAQGRSLLDILSHLEGTAEGVNTSQVVVQLAKQHAISVPISQQVNYLLQGTMTPQAAVKALMLRDHKPETRLEPEKNE